MSVEELQETARVEANLSSVPALKPPAALWGSQKAEPRTIALKLDAARDAHGEVDIAEAVAIAGEIVDFFYKIAVNKEDYIRWAQGLSGEDEYEIPFALLGKYVRAEGE